MEFLFVPIIFGSALVLLSIGRFIGKKHEIHTSCSAGRNINGVDASCGACSNEDIKFYKSKNDPGFENVAKLGNPTRNKRFIDKLHFRPERFN
ncbi:MAG: hypothetical protein GF313_04340 [Caldithrix sp.]|nr:hypothetical protein [Caldithrix sp.]